MRRTTLAVVLVLFVYAAPARAQLKYGLIGGVNLTHLDVTDSNPAIPPNDIYHGKVTATAGVILLFPPITSRLTIRTDLMFVAKGATVSGAALQGEAGSLDLGYFEMPVLAVVDIMGGRIRPYVLAGPSLGLLLGAYVHDPVLEGSTDVKYAFREPTFSMNAGGGVAFLTRRARFFVETRYARGLSNIELEQETLPNGQSRANTESMKTKAVQILVGVTMR